VGLRIRPQDLTKELRARFRKMPGVIKDGSHLGALEGQRILAVRTPRYTGATAANWRARRGIGKKELSEIHNDSPYVGVLEMGARPHPVSEEGVRAIARWAQLKLGVDAEEAGKIANAVAWRIRKKGQPATYFVRDSRGDLADAAARNIAYAIAEFAKRRAT